MCIFNVWVSSNCSKNGESSGFRGLYISSKLSKMLSKKFLHMYFFLPPLHYQNSGFIAWLHFLQFWFWLPELKCNALQVFVLEDPDYDDDDDSWTILRQFGSNYETVLDNLFETILKYFLAILQDNFEITLGWLWDSLGRHGDFLVTIGGALGQHSAIVIVYLSSLSIFSGERPF